MGLGINTKRIIVSNLEIEVSKKNIKNMYLKVSRHDGRVRISAPLITSDEVILEFALNKIDWIKKQLDKFEKQSDQTTKDYLNGEIHYVWGKPYNLKISHGSKRKVNIIDNTLILKVYNDSTNDQLEKLLMEWYRKQLKLRLPDLFEKWESIIGVKAKGVTIRNMKSRWGSCNIRSKRISINLQLAKKPVICLEYVIVHELVHLLEHSHNNVFKRYMDEFLPNWRDIKGILTY